MHTEARILESLDALSSQVEELRRAQRQRDELMSELMPILKLVTDTGIERLDELDRRGYFRFGQALLEVVDRVVSGYSAEDVEQLAENVVSILDLVRSLTQPEVLQIASEVSDVAADERAPAPVGVMGMVKASQDEDAQRGMAILLEVLKRLGKGVKKAERRRKLQAQLGSRRGSGRNPTRTTRPRQESGQHTTRPQAMTPAPSAATTAADVSAQPPLNLGPEFTSEGFLLEASTWTPELAKRVAASMGVTLNEQHWQLIEFAREEFQRTGASPNIRRLTTGSGISTREIYQMFPKAPGKCTARIAGLPKPVGCI